MTNSSSRMRTVRRQAALLAGLALACGLAVPAASASARPPAHHAAAAALAGQRAHAGRPAISARERAFTDSRAGRALQAAEATARTTAMASHRPVTIASATTPTSTLVAEPDGQFQGTNSVQPMRFQRAGTWITINTSLRRGPGHTWMPVAVPAGVVLSDGGTGPVATLTTPAGHRTSLRFPGSLSAPAVSGSTATYQAANGTTVRLSITLQGGVTEAVTAPAGNAPLPIRHLRPGVTISPAAARPLTGTWSASPAPRPAFDITRPVTVPAGGTRAATAAGTEVAMTVTPDTAPSCTSNGEGQACDQTADSGGTFTEVEEWDPGTNFEGDANVNGYGEGIGNDVYEAGTGDCTETVCLGRAYYQIPLTELNDNMYVTGATLYETENYGSDQGCYPWSAQLWWTGNITKSTTWVTQPGHVQSVGTDTSLDSAYNQDGDSCAKNISFDFNVVTEMQDATTGSWANWTVEIAGDEAATANPQGLSDGPCAGGDNGSVNGVSNLGYNCGWMQISDNPYIVTSYDYNPPSPANLASSPEPVDYPLHNDEGCGNAIPYLDETSVQLSGQVYSNWSTEPVKGLFTMVGYGKNIVSLPNSGWEPSAETAGANQVAGGNDVLSNGNTANIQATGLLSGDFYEWDLMSETDGASWGADNSQGPLGSLAAPECDFIVDTAAPQTPTVTNATVNPNGSVTLTLFDSQNQNTGCGFSPCYQSGIYDFEYQLNNNQFATDPPTVPASGWSSTFPYPAANYTGPIVTPIQATSGTGTSMCLDDYGASTTAGNKIDLWNCDDSTAQNWTYNASTEELQVEGMCADAAGNGVKEGTLIVLEPCSASTAGEGWEQGPSGELFNTNSGRCLNDPAGSGTPGTQQILWGCTGTANEDYGDAIGTVTVTPAHWGYNTIFLQALTTAGVPAARYLGYTFNAPSNETVVPGDVTGDGIPDLLATTTNSGLYVYPGVKGGDTLESAFPASAADGSPDSSSDWNDYLITHRGALTGQATDELYAYNTTTGFFYECQNADQSAEDFPGTPPYGDCGGTEPITKPTSAFSGTGYVGTVGTSCSGETAWSCAGLTQILAVGDPDDSTASPTGLLTIENGNLWYYPGVAGGALGDPTELGTSTTSSSWNNMTLIAPGYEGPQNQLVLWARDNTTGDLYSYQFSEDSGTWTLSNSGTATPIAPEDTSTGATQITLPSGVPALNAADYPTIASAGDAVEPAALYVVDSSGNIWALAGNPDPTSAADPLQGSLTEVGSTPSGDTIQQIS
jgi:hypothetical protein